MSCPVCTEPRPHAEIATEKIKDIPYHMCGWCGSIYTLADISQLVVTENDNDVSRAKQNKDRIERALLALKLPAYTAFDFGCGNGQLVDELNRRGIAAVGIDRGTDAQMNNLPFETYDLAFMVEVIEHLPNPIQMIHDILRKLKPGGLLYLESTFAEGLKARWWTDSYVDPSIGHITILSRKELIEQLGFKQVNSNVLTLIKGRP